MYLSPSSPSACVSLSPPLLSHPPIATRRFPLPLLRCHTSGPEGWVLTRDAAGCLGFYARAYAEGLAGGHPRRLLTEFSSVYTSAFWLKIIRILIIIRILTTFAIHLLAIYMLLMDGY